MAPQDGRSATGFGQLTEESQGLSGVGLIQAGNGETGVDDDPIADLGLFEEGEIRLDPGPEMVHPAGLVDLVDLDDFGRHGQAHVQGLRRGIICYNAGMLKSLEGFLAPGSEEARLSELVDFKRLPRHIAVIMDGNGRWAKGRGLPRAQGHRAGAKAVREAIETSVRLGLQYLTLYAFSKENWRRPKPEVLTLWRLLVEYLRKEEKLLVDNRIRLRALGQKAGLPPKVRRELERVEDATRSFGGLQLCVALNYGGRAEIVDAARDILRGGGAPEDLTEEIFARHLYLPEVPDPDLLIRTSGEFRVSNFLLWQIAYAEIWITPDYWPDFNRRHMLQAIVDFQKRERRFGDIQARS